PPGGAARRPRSRSAPGRGRAAALSSAGLHQVGGREPEREGAGAAQAVAVVDLVHGPPGGVADVGARLVGLDDGPLVGSRQQAPLAHLPAARVVPAPQHPVRGEDEHRLLRPRGGDRGDGPGVQEAPLPGVGVEHPHPAVPRRTGQHTAPGPPVKPSGPSRRPPLRLRVDRAYVVTADEKGTAGTGEDGAPARDRRAARLPALSRPPGGRALTGEDLDATVHRHVEPVPEGQRALVRDGPEPRDVPLLQPRPIQQPRAAVTGHRHHAVTGEHPPPVHRAEVPGRGAVVVHVVPVVDGPRPAVDDAQRPRAVRDVREPPVPFDPGDPPEPRDLGHVFGDQVEHVHGGVVRQHQPVLRLGRLLGPGHVPVRLRFRGVGAAPGERDQRGQRRAPPPHRATRYASAETKNSATATAAMVAPAAVPRCQDRSNPSTAATMPSSAAPAMIIGMRRAHSAIAAGGATRRPNTSSVPTTWNDATMASVTSPTSSACASRGRSPSVLALRGSKASATNIRCPSAATSAATAGAPASEPRSRPRTASTSPNRNPARSTANDRECDTMITPSASMPANSSPVLVSCDSRRGRPSTLTPAAIAIAAVAPPATTSPPSSEASATPGSIPWDIASPRNAIPRSTTQVPAKAHTSDTRTDAHSAFRTKDTSKGPYHHSMTRTLQ